MSAYRDPVEPAPASDVCADGFDGLGKTIPPSDHGRKLRIGPLLLLWDYRVHFMPRVEHWHRRVHRSHPVWRSTGVCVGPLFFGVCRVGKHLDAARAASEVSP